ncbi:hypothetical protein [Actinokineospora bangkokensis]|uniref:hypothetical protein n=1 Tax=Actinokineospora bangkokensis TaxID=1193682 RepID=UPI001177BF6C|nr:hypothetical protein [Actinokineospora bangkokensis]
MTSVLSTAIGLGLPLGVVAFVFQVTPIGFLVQAPAFWALWAFAAGVVVPGPLAAAATGALTELIGLGTCSLIVWLTGDVARQAGGPHALVLVGGAALGGALVATAGCWWRSEDRAVHVALGTALPVAAFGWSSAHDATAPGGASHALLHAAIAATLLALLPRDGRARLRATAALVPTAAVLALLAWGLLGTGLVGA